jgi:hypothetical protein
MKIGILGSGSVGQALAAGFAARGDGVMIASREPEKLAAFAATAHVKTGSFADAAAFGELLVLAVKGDATAQAIELAGRANFDGKIVIDPTNPLLFEKEGVAPTLSVRAPDSLGQRVQAEIPHARVVKAFNTVPAFLMCNALKAGDTPVLFIAGDNLDAVGQVASIAKGWGWHAEPIGGMNQAYLLETLALLWIRYGFEHNHWTHAFKLLNPAPSTKN